MITSSGLGASGTGRRLFAVFARLVAISVGLANLAILAIMTELFDDTPPLISVLIAVVAGLATAEIVLRWFRRTTLAEKFSNRYAFVVMAVCFGGVLMGVLLASVLSISNAVLEPRPTTIPELVMVALAGGFMGIPFGLGLGLVEGLILAFPLAAALGRFRSRG